MEALGEQTCYLVLPRRTTWKACCTTSRASSLVTVTPILPLRNDWIQQEAAKSELVCTNEQYDLLRTRSAHLMGGRLSTPLSSCGMCGEVLRQASVERSAQSTNWRSSNGRTSHLPFHVGISS